MALFVRRHNQHNFVFLNTFFGTNIRFPVRKKVKLVTVSILRLVSASAAPPAASGSAAPGSKIAAATAAATARVTRGRRLRWRVPDVRGRGEHEGGGGERDGGGKEEGEGGHSHRAAEAEEVAV